MKFNLKEKFYSVKSYLILFIQIVIVVEAYIYFGKYGILGFLIAILILFLVRGWKYRKLFLNQLKQIETIMWGKPLDRDKWKKGEINRIKLKPHFRKKNKGVDKNVEDKQDKKSIDYAKND